VLLRLRFAQLRLTPLGRMALAAALSLPFGATIGDTVRACGGEDALLSTFDDVVIAFTGGDVLVAARASGDDARALACARGAIRGSDATLEGTPAIRGADGQTYATLRDGLLLVGSDALVREARTPHAAGRPSRALLEVDDGMAAVLSVVTTDPEAPVRAVDVVLRDEASRLEISADATCTSDEATRDLTATFDTLARLGAEEPALDPAVVAALGEMHGRASHAHATTAVAVTRGGRREGALLVALIGGVRRYVTHTKTVEARNVLREVSTRLAGRAAMESRSGTPFPASTVPVPRQVPRGTHTLPRPAEWDQPAWRALEFRIDVPIYYSYAIVTAADGRSAVVQARGDLDGDQDESLFEIRVGLTRDGKVHVGDLTVTRELE
jgi:hypothetical protein